MIALAHQKPRESLFWEPTLHRRWTQGHPLASVVSSYRLQRRAQWQMLLIDNGSDVIHVPDEAQKINSTGESNLI